MNVPFSYASPTLSVEALKHSIAYKLMFIIGKDPAIANKHEWLNATLFAVRDRMVERWLRSNRAQLSQEVRQVYYLSMEFLIGRTLSNALLSLGIYDDVSSALAEMGLDLEELIDEENDPGLGNGGLGRLAACFLDSRRRWVCRDAVTASATTTGCLNRILSMAGKKESPDYWLEYGNPWEFERHNTRYKVRFGGRIQQEGKKTRWIETEEIIAEAYDQIIPGFDTDATNTLRLWSAQASSEINLGKFNQGDYFAAVEDKNHSENVSRVLYPDDSTYSGRELRLRQEYFLVSATVQDILSRHYMLHKTYDNLADKIAIHLNDTHPVLSIPELMRLLIDEHKFSWDEAFEVTCQVFSYTNHTLMSEALETWPVDMLGKILPRHLQIIFEINDYFLKTLQEQYPNDTDLLSRTSIIDESNGRRVRMAWLAVVVSHKVNGVSELHSRLMVESLFAEFAKIFPMRFINVTNGVTPRRWLALANPPLSKVLDEHIGRTWRTDLSQLDELKQHIDYPMVNQAVRQAKFENKQRLASYIAQQLNVVVNPKALFDVPDQTYP
ncbi:glycogen/starch/alpha-glucan family phosphorylase [Klebsiella pneumoniae subsp. pneumoniae]|nr:glycogen/starch/alpha-glucan family phosphorylase [Klebsiella pneumoniae subsp. pneumoniae]